MNGDEGPFFDLDIDPVEYGHAVLINDCEIADRNITGKMGNFLRSCVKQLLINHAWLCKLFGDCAVTQADILNLAVIGQQFAPGRHQVLVRGQSRSERADRQLSLDNQISAYGQEQKRGQLIDEIVEKFHQKLEIVNLQSNFEYVTEPTGEIGKRITQAIDCTQGFNAGNGFSDAIRQRTNDQDTFLVQVVYLALQPWNNIGLQWDQDDGSHTQPQVLYK